MSAKRKQKKLLTTKDVAKILKINAELVTYLRQHEKLPYIKNSKYILFSEPEVVRWRNKKLARDSEVVMNLKEYYLKIKLDKFIDYDSFRIQVENIAMLDGDSVIKYIERYNIEKNIVDVVGDIVHAYWNNLRPKCKKCGRIIVGSLPLEICSVCRAREIDPEAFMRQDD